MAASSTNRDPRSVVTPDAFGVSDELLGARLASPARRLAALMLDGIFIGFLVALTRSFALILGVVAAVLFIRAGFKRTPVRGSVFGRAMRFSVGCLGVFVAIVTAALWVAVGPDFGRNDGDDTPRVTVSFDGEEPTGPVSQVIGAVAELAVTTALGRAQTLEDAESETLDIIEAAEELGVERDELRELLEGAVPQEAEWGEQAPALFDRLLGVQREPIEYRELAAVADEVSLYTTEEALAAYVQLLVSGRDGEMDEARREALEVRLAEEVAADTLRALGRRISDLEDEGEATREALVQATEGGLFGALRDLLDELGFGFGWASIYMTVMLSWWKGQTIGKRILGIRVVRLDGGPITWWVAFERVGGYAAGVATGLLGFAQVYWDANRQAIHDRIVGTVVLLDGADKVIDWESAL